METRGMELHVRNVPRQATENGFKKFMKPHLTRLSIFDAHCGKQRDRPFASVTFLNVTDGQKFLQHHGQDRKDKGRRATPMSNSVMVLRFHNQPIYFERSINDPNPYLIRVLATEEKDSIMKVRTVSTRVEPVREKIYPVDFDCSGVSCGVWDYKASELVYTPEFRWNVPGVACFGERVMILRLENGQRIDFKYSSIWEIIAEAGSIYSFIFSMMEPPQFYEKITEDPIAQLMEQLNNASIYIKGPQKKKNSQDRHRLAYLSNDQKPIASNCLVYRIILKGTARSDMRIWEDIGSLMHVLGKAHGIPRMTHRSIDVMMPKESHVHGMLRLNTELADTGLGLPFKLLFQLQRLAYNNYLTPAKVLGLIPAIKIMVERSSEAVLINVVKKLATQIDFPGPDTDPDDFKLDALIELLKENESHFIRNGHGLQLEESQNVALIHRAEVTPSGIRLGGPQKETTNRVLRKYPEHHDYFLRVRFCDEDGQPVQYNPKVSNDRIYNGRFKEILRDGINIAGRSYGFLGFSHSSLRAQTCWFMAPFSYERSLLLSHMLIQDLGEFTLIQSPAKCAARIGQVFSDTPTTVSLGSDVIVTRIPDVNFEDRVFSDGVGTISPAVMEKIWGKLPKNRPLKPTCFQIRYSGAKGMISLDPRLTGSQLVLRPSMIKFEGSNNTDLEICEAAWKPLPLFLNRQFIKILEDMGVSNNFFLEHQAREIERLRTITSSPVNASIFLRRQNIGDQIHLHWLINELSVLDIDYRTDGFLRDAVEMATLVELRSLKHKTRIPVPDGWHLHGVMDEFGILEEGQVFIIVNENGVSKIITGERIIISRAPCLHPGDVQVVQAISVPRNSPLRCLHNCVVFSQKGKRDLPSQLSGGDLDGDRYFVIWDKAAVPTRIFEPADYLRKDPINLGRPVTPEDITDHFVLFMETDQLGRCAVLHRVYADQKDKGTADEVCVKLAEMHSTAVDFSKTGIPVDTTEFPYSPRWRPDFEAPGPHVEIESIAGISFEEPSSRDSDYGDEEEDFARYRYYESEKILGKLYRAIDERKIFNEIKERSRVHTGLHALTAIHVVWGYVQQKCALIQWGHLKQWAIDIREDYEEAVHHTMVEYGQTSTRPLTELEVLVGNILGRTGAQSRRQLNDSITLKEKFDSDSAFIVHRILNDENGQSGEALERTIACLAVSLEEWPGRRGKDRLLSFKYVAAALCLREVDRM